MKFISLSSGSSGNCYYIQSGGAKILIDAGVSTRYIKNALKQFDISIEEIDAVFITHEHNDHTYGVEVLSRNYNIPVYSNQLTTDNIISRNHIKRKDLFNSFDNEINIKDLNIHTFAVNHDAVNPVGYVINDKDTKFSVITDTGCITKDIYESIKGSKAIVLESNHDIEMLQNGPYHYALKQRILSNVGHLSNDAAGKTAVKLINDGTVEIILGHISSTNNTYDMVFQSICYYLSANNMNIGQDVIIDIAKKCETSTMHIF